jgi:hypothetical protein
MLMFVVIKTICILMFGRLILFDVGVVDDLSNGNCIENRFI